MELEITPEKAAKKLGMAPQKLRVMLQLGYLREIGIAFKKQGNKTWTYSIHEEAVDRYLGGANEKSS